LTAAAVEACGWQCIFTPAEGFDLVATREARFVRIQVKSCATLEKNGSYRFWVAHGTSRKKIYTTSEADIVALVAIPLRRVYFKPTVQLTTSTIRMKAEDFQGEVETETWTTATSIATGRAWAK
jgi:hypothetical protein